MNTTEARSYPRRVRTDGGEIEFRHMTAADEAAVLAFAQKLPVHDLLFIPRNISQPKVLSAWIKEIERGFLWVNKGEGKAVHGLRETAKGTKSVSADVPLTSR